MCEFIPHSGDQLIITHSAYSFYSCQPKHTEYGKFKKYLRFNKTIKWCKAYQTHFYFYCFVYFFILRGKLLLLQNSLILSWKDYGFDIKTFDIKALSSCIVCSAFSWSVEQGSTLEAPFFSKVPMPYSFLLKTR